MSKRNQHKNPTTPFVTPIARPSSDWQPYVAPAGVALLVILGFVNWSGNRELQDDLMRQRAQFDDLANRIAPPQPAAPEPAAAPPIQPAEAEQQVPLGTFVVETQGAPSKGPANAPITLAVFSDFQCPPCGMVVPTMEQVLQTYGDTVRLVWKHRPLPEHKDAPLAHRAAIAAHEQGKFWEYHDKLFTDPQKLQREQLLQYAREVGLDMPRFEEALASSRSQKVMDDDLKEAASLDVTATPTFFVNGTFFFGAHPYPKFVQAINTELGRLKLPVPPAAQAAAGT